jgi:HK97 family phage major capsid protein
VYQLMTAGIAAFRMPTTKITTDSGETMQFPRINAHGIATQVIAQGTAIGGTDPTFLAQLDAFKYGQLVQVANETITDSGFDVARFVGGNIARAVAQVVDADLIVGTGSGEPLGMMAASWTGAAGTVATGGSLITPTYENLVDLVYSRERPVPARLGVAFLMRDATAGIIRKLRDGAGGTIGAAAVAAVPDLAAPHRRAGPLFGYPVYTDPNVASSRRTPASQRSATGTRTTPAGRQLRHRALGRLRVQRPTSSPSAASSVSTGTTIDLTAVNMLKQSV